MVRRSSTCGRRALARAARAATVVAAALTAARTSRYVQGTARTDRWGIEDPLQDLDQHVGEGPSGDGTGDEAGDRDDAGLGPHEGAQLS